VSSLAALPCTASGGFPGTIVATTDANNTDANDIVTLHCIPSSSGPPVCTHSVGIGALTYTDCNFPLGIPGDPGTYNSVMANEAAAALNAFIGGTGTISTGFCGSSPVVTLVPASGTPILWAYGDGNAAHVDQFGSCPTVLDPTWN
jgi:hypothetical protein